MTSSDILFCFFFKSKNEGVHRNSKCAHKQGSFIFTQAEQKQKKESLQQLILCPLMLKLKKNAESIPEKSIHKKISSCPVVFFVHGADQSPRMEEGAGAVGKQSPVSLL